MYQNPFSTCFSIKYLRCHLTFVLIELVMLQLSLKVVDQMLRLGWEGDGLLQS